MRFALYSLQVASTVPWSTARDGFTQLRLENASACEGHCVEHQLEPEKSNAVSTTVKRVYTLIKGLRTVLFTELLNGLSPSSSAAEVHALSRGPCVHFGVQSLDDARPSTFLGWPKRAGLTKDRCLVPSAWPVPFDS